MPETRGRAAGGGHGSPLQYSGLESHGERSLWHTVHGFTDRQTRLSDLSTQHKSPLGASTLLQTVAFLLVTG